MRKTNDNTGVKIESILKSYPYHLLEPIFNLEQTERFTVPNLSKKLF